MNTKAESNQYNRFLTEMKVSRIFIQEKLRVAMDWLVRSPKITLNTRSMIQQSMKLDENS